MESLLLRISIFSVIISVQGAASAAVIEVGEGSATTIVCPLNVQYPTWTGPDGLARPINNMRTINEPLMTWVDGKDLRISKVMLKHDGNYTCSDGNGISRTMVVDVQYFQMSASFTTATVENSTTTLTCTCFSNPMCKIVPHIKTHIRDGQKYHDSVTTFKDYETDPLNENRTKSSVITVMHVYKEDNGLEMNCAFEYKDVKEYAILYPKVKVLFPPTRVNISVNMADSKLTLDCSTDSSNPVSSLTWRRGVSPVASNNPMINSGNNEIVLDAEYHGKNVSQTIDIDPKSIVNGEKIFCCFRYHSEEKCDSMNLSSYQISGGYVYKYSMATVLLCMMFLTM